MHVISHFDGSWWILARDCTHVICVHDQTHSPMLPVETMLEPRGRISADSECYVPNFGPGLRWRRCVSKYGTCMQGYPPRPQPMSAAQIHTAKNYKPACTFAFFHNTHLFRHVACIQIIEKRFGVEELCQSLDHFLFGSLFLPAARLFVLPQQQRRPKDQELHLLHGWLDGFVVCCGRQVHCGGFPLVHVCLCRCFGHGQG